MPTSRVTVRMPPASASGAPMAKRANSAALRRILLGGQLPHRGRASMVAPWYKRGMGLRAVLFDLDGTLADTERQNADAVARVLTRAGRPLSDEEREFV